MKTLDDLPDSIASRLCRLLSLASNNPEKEEAEQALARAKALATQYKVDLASIDVHSATSHGLSKEEFVNVKFQTAAGTHRRPPSHKWITSILIDHFDVRIVYQHLSSTIWITGRQSSVQFAIYAYSFLKNTFNRLWVAYKQESGAPSSSRNSFFYGIWLGLDQKLREEGEKSKKEAIEKIADVSVRNRVTDQYQITLVKEEELLEQAYAGFHPVLRKPKAFNYGQVRDDESRFHGYRRGMEINIATPIEETASKKGNKEALPGE